VAQETQPAGETDGLGNPRHQPKTNGEQKESRSEIAQTDNRVDIRRGEGNYYAYENRERQYPEYAANQLARI
jgi:hypothetical protein